MKLAQAIPREAVIVIGGAILAALIIGELPALREWIAARWRPGSSASGCGCGGR